MSDKDDELIRRGDALNACKPKGYDHAHHMQAKSDCFDAIAALPAVQPAPDATPLSPTALPAVQPVVTVKPLVWVRLANGALKADTALARYVVSGGCWALWTHTHGETKRAANEEAAIAAAQADYAARILAALDVQPKGILIPKRLVPELISWAQSEQQNWPMETAYQDDLAALIAALDVQPASDAAPLSPTAVDANPAPDTDPKVAALVEALLCVRDYVEDASRGQLLYRGKSDITEMAAEDLARINAALAAREGRGNE
jgi:hypothetical protein